MPPKKPTSSKPAPQRGARAAPRPHAALADLAAVFDASADAMVVFDLQGRIRFANEAACRAHGYTREEMLGLSIADLEVPEDRPLARERLAGLERQGSARFEVRNLRKDGTSFPAEAQVRLVELDGEPLIVGSARDISAAKRLEQELRTSEARLRSVLDNVPDLILELDPAGTILYVNRLRADADAAAFLGRAVADLVVPEQRGMVAEALERAARTQLPVDIEAQAPDRAANMTWWWARVAPVVQDGRTTGLLIATREVTKRKLAEHALRSAEHQLRDLFDTVPLLAVIVDADGRLSYANHRCLALLGYRPEEIVGQPWLERCVPPDTRALVLPVLERMARWASVPEQFEYAVLTKDGTRRLVAWSLTVLRTPEGRAGALASIGEDVTERRLAEEALRASEEKFRALFAASVDAIGLVDAESGRILDANDAMLRLYGYARDELVGREVTTLSADPDATREAYRRLAAGELHSIQRRRGRRKDGSSFLVDIANGLYELRGRRVVCAVVRDVSEQVAAEEALVAAHEDLEATLRALPDLLFVLDAERRIRDFRAPHAELLYAAPDRFIGQRLGDVLPPDAAEVVERSLAAADRDGANYGGVYALDMPAGQRWFELSITRRGGPDEAGRIFIALARDITAQHVAEDQLRRSEQLNRALVEGSGASIALFDPTGQVLLLNPAAADLVSGTPQDYLGKSMGEVRTALDHDVLAARLQEALRTGEPKQYEDQVRLTGGKRWFLSKWQPLRDRDGSVTAVQLMALDITERRQAEERERTMAEKLQQTQRLESLGVLAGGIAHDFNNLLSGILGNADLAVLELPPGSAARAPLEQVLSGARRAAELTRQMLAYSGKGRFVIETVRLRDLVEEMGHLLEISISKNHVLRNDFADDVPRVDADVAQLRQVVMNLIINASEAIGDRSGAIALRVGALHGDRETLAEYYLGDSLEPGTYVYLEVADTGAGMSPEVRERIFEPFFSTKFAGRGLGLAAALGIVRGHRGAISIRSEPGHGTTFRILLPASSAEATATARTSGPHDWKASGLAMVVDDEETVLSTSRRMLERLGFDVLAANSGRKALDLLEQRAGAARVVLLDLTMPDMDGEQTCAEIRRRWPALPVVLTSGYSEQEVLQRFVGVGPAGFVQKPYGFDTLRQAMRAAVEPPAGEPAAGP